MRSMLMELGQLNLAGRICEEFGAGLHELRMLTELERLARKARRESDGGSQTDSTG